MRAITKGREPESLTLHRKSPYSSYDNYGEKQDLREALVAEQRGLCCYCMGRIRPTRQSVKIEHWRCQSNYPDRQLDYRNLLAACQGRIGYLGGQPTHLQHCDTKKGDSDLQWNPADPAHRVETRIRYRVDGSICSDDVTFNDELNEVLNLNLPLLKNNRVGVLDGVLGWWKKTKAEIRGPVPRDRFIRERDRQVGGDGDLAEYCQVAVWWLEQRLARMEA
ncbi:retron system putative HNH endonuclease [Candidatus Palauibacter sp.]|uniref:retron system putative HNH endonuclease n=1 Tax=Candidatus Palauibacter sp. TaxID=3101350 RepID=UPI003B014D5C